MTSEPGPGQAVVSLREALDATADALAEARLDALLSTEAGLASALERLPSAESLGALDRLERRRVREDLAEARRSLRRCARLGASLAEFVRASLLAQGRTGAYSRSGQESELAARSAALNTRG